MFKKLIILLSSIFISSFMVSAFTKEYCEKITSAQLKGNITDQGDYWGLYIPEDSQNVTINGKKIIGAQIFLGKSHFALQQPDLQEFAQKMVLLNYAATKKGQNYIMCTYNDDTAILKKGSKRYNTTIMFSME